jgi:glycogen debranching enzyme
MDFNSAVGFDPVRIFNECPYRVNDIGIISILQRSSVDLVALCTEFGMDDAAREMQAQVDRTHHAVQALWSPRWRQYVSRDTLTGRLLEVPTSAGLLAAYAGFPNDCAATVADWLEETRFGIPSTRSTFGGFEPLRYWRGPVWQHMNMLIATGLADHGHTALAERIRFDSAELLRKQGFHEYYDPLTGNGLGGAEFSWTAATYLHWVHP